MVQLNGAEGPQFCAEVARRTGVKVIKAIHVASAADVHAAEAFRTDFHLFDRRGKGLWGGTGESFDWELLREHRSEVPAILAGGLRPDNVAEAIAVTHPYAVDVASGVEAEPGRKDHAAMAAFFEAAQGRLASRPHERGRGAIRPLRGPLRAGDADRGARRADRGLGARRARTPTSTARLRLLHRDFIGRPTPLYLAERLSERAGRRVYLKREDLAHTGAHKINNAIGQALLAAADGQAAGDRRDRRRPARRRHRDRLRPARPRVRRLHGHRGHPPPGAQRRADGAARGRGGAGRGRRPHPEGGGQRRDPRLGRQRRDDPLRDRLGGRPGALSRPWSATCSG